MWWLKTRLWVTDDPGTRDGARGLTLLGDAADVDTSTASRRGGNPAPVC